MVIFSDFRLRIFGDPKLNLEKCDGRVRYGAGKALDTSTRQP